MSAFKDTIKPYFLTGKKPTQAQFLSLFDKIWFKDEELAVSDIDGLQDILDALGTGILGRPEEMQLADDGGFHMYTKYKLESVAIRNNSSTNITLAFNYSGYTGGGNWHEILIPANGVVDLEINQTFWVEKTITVTGISGPAYDVDYPITLLIFRK